MFHHFPSLFFIFHLHRFSSRFIIFHNFFIFFNLDKSRRIPSNLSESTQFLANPPNSPRIHWVFCESAKVQRYEFTNIRFTIGSYFQTIPLQRLCQRICGTVRTPNNSATDFCNTQASCHESPNSSLKHSQFPFTYPYGLLLCLTGQCSD